MRKPPSKPILSNQGHTFKPQVQQTSSTAVLEVTLSTSTQGTGLQSSIPVRPSLTRNKATLGGPKPSRDLIPRPQWLMLPCYTLNR